MFGVQRRAIETAVGFPLSFQERREDATPKEYGELAAQHLPFVPDGNGNRYAVIASGERPDGTSFELRLTTVDLFTNPADALRAMFVSPLMNEKVAYYAIYGRMFEICQASRPETP